jgi:hypothetical protein
LPQLPTAECCCWTDKPWLSAVMWRKVPRSLRGADARNLPKADLILLATGASVQSDG